VPASSGGIYKESSLTVALFASSLFVLCYVCRAAVSFALRTKSLLAPQTYRKALHRAFRYNRSRFEKSSCLFYRPRQGLQRKSFLRLPLWRKKIGAKSPVPFAPKFQKAKGRRPNKEILNK